jgi:hypothetical protein
VIDRWTGRCLYCGWGQEEQMADEAGDGLRIWDQDIADYRAARQVDIDRLLRTAAAYAELRQMIEAADVRLRRDLDVLRQRAELGAA